MAALTPQVVSIAGTAPTYAAASAGGDTVPAGERTWIHVKNAGGSPITVTVTTPGTVSGLAIADVSVSVPATTGERLIGPLPSNLFGDQVAVSYSGVTTVTIAALQI
jgi:hypothetical protein